MEGGMPRKHRILRPGAGLVPAEYTVDRESASAALPERTVVLPDTPVVGDPRARARLPKSRVEAPAAAGRVETPRLMDAGTIGLPKARGSSQPAEPEPAPAATPDERTAAWFAALVPGEAQDAAPTIVEVRDASGDHVEEAPTIDTVENALRGRGSRRRSKRFGGLKVVLEQDDGRRINVNIE
jgi:hypothetical protein